MLKGKTVFVIGAGGSVPFGFPTGANLKWYICDQLSGNLQRRALSRALVEDSDADTNDIDEFRTALLESQRDSVDIFIQHNRRFERIGKQAIAGAIIQHENRGALFDPRYCGGGRSWYAWIVNRLFDDLSDIPNLPLSFVTFNYDTSLEEALSAAIDQYSGTPEEKQAAKNWINVIHLHGKITRQAKFGRSIQQSGTFLPQVAEGLRIVSDEGVAENEEFRQADGLIREADVVCFIGFGYAPDNLNNLVTIRGGHGEGAGFDTKTDRQLPELKLCTFGLPPSRYSEMNAWFLERHLSIAKAPTDLDAYRFLDEFANLI